MRNKLTEKQINQLPVFIDKVINITSQKMHIPTMMTYVKKMYKSIGEDEPIIIYSESPLSTAIMCAIYQTIFKNFKYSQLHSQLDSQLYSQLDSQLYSQLRSQLDSQLYSHLESQLRSQLDSHLESQLDSQLYSQLHSQLRSQLRSQLDSHLESQLDSQLYSQLHSQLRSQLDSQLHSHLESQLYSQLRLQLGSQIHSQLDSQLDSINKNWYLTTYWLVWCGWYMFGKYIGINFDYEKYDLFINFVREVSFIIPYKGICFVSKKPSEIHWHNNLLHKDGGAAVKYADGYSIYSLNGIRVPQYLAETPSGKLNIEFWQKELNTDVRAEFIRKYGVERMLDKCTLIDTYKNHNNEWWSKSQYELYDAYPLYKDVTKHSTCPHLKMLNQSTGIWHVEGVAPECKTIKEALNWRENNKENYKTLLIK